MSELNNLIDEIRGAIAKYLTDKLVDIKEVKIGDTVSDNQISEIEEQIAKEQITKDEIIHWNMKNIKEATEE